MPAARSAERPSLAGEPSLARRPPPDGEPSLARKPPPDGQPSLVEEQREVARARILRAARHVLAERGLATRVEDVAAAAGVGRRTVFRHFDSRDALLAAAVTDGMRSYAEHIPRPGPDASLEQWLEEFLVAVHHMNARHGRIYWELAFAPDVGRELAEVAESRREGRRQLVGRVAAWSWRAAGGRGRPPAWLADAFAVYLSAFATQALVGDFGRRPEEVGRAAARTLAAATRQAVGEAALSARVAARQ